jgi:hypothetical protein
MKESTLAIVVLDCHGDVNWTLRIRSKLAALPNKELRARLEWTPDDEIGKLELSVASKLVMIRIVTERVNDGIRKLEDDLKLRSQDVSMCIERSCVLPLQDPRLVWELMLDIDSFVHQMRSAYEITGKFLKELFLRLFERQVSEPDIKDALQKRSVDTAWARVLQEARKDFFHERAPGGVAVEVYTANPSASLDLFILREGTEPFRLRECRTIYDGFSKTLVAIENWICDEGRKYGQE